MHVFSGFLVEYRTWLRDVGVRWVFFDAARQRMLRSFHMKAAWIIRFGCACNYTVLNVGNAQDQGPLDPQVSMVTMGWRTAHFFWILWQTF